MQQNYIDGIELHKLFTGGYRSLKKNMAAVNDLNVFPVPDGDTGTNMVQTFGGGLLSTSGDIENTGEYMKRLSKAVLLSARGNSGVILSQFVHGLYRGFANKDKIEFHDFTYAFACAVEDAYKSILTPTEGTILTVIREAAEFLQKKGDSYPDFESGFKALIERMEISLANTPNLLPVLKEAGVVDSGGAGLLCFMKGIYASLINEEIEDVPDLAEMSHTASSADIDFGPDTVLEYGYCTEFILQLMNYKTDLEKFDLDSFTKPLEEMGDSIVAVHNGGIVKIHIHTFAPEKVLEYGRRLGEFVSVKIENMSIQHSEVQAEAPKKEKLKYAVVAVASGDGIVDYFYSIGANAVIDGGQTNNPSVNAFLEAFQKFDAEHIIVLPNNSNIILTANQAAEMFKTSDVRVIPTKSVVEGYSALSMMNPWCDTVEEFIENMTSGLGNVTSASVTIAVRDAVLEGVEVKKDEFIGLCGKTLLSKGDSRVSTAFELIKSITDTTPKEVIIIFYGQNVSDSEVAELEGMLNEAYPLADVGFVNGKQSVYDFIISLE